MSLSKIVLSSFIVLSTTLSASAHAQSNDRIGWSGGINVPPAPPSSTHSNPRDKANEREQREERREERREDRRQQNGQWDDQQIGLDDGRFGQVHNIEININQYLQGNNRLDLLRDSYVRQQLQGNVITSISVTALTEFGQGRISLLANGSPTEQPIVVGTTLSNYNLRTLPGANVLGLNLSTLELQLGGKFYIQSATITVIDGTPFPGPQPLPRIETLRQQLNQRIHEEGAIHLFRLFNLEMERRGQTIKRVTVVASALRSFAQASLHINNSPTTFPQQVGNRTRLIFDLNNNQRIGQDIQSLQVYFRGDVLVEEVSIEIENGAITPMPWPRPGPLESRIDQVINQRLYDTSGVNLTALMRIDRRHEERIVDSVDIMLRNSDYGTIVKLCKNVIDRFSSINCGLNETIFPGTRAVRLSPPSYSKLKDLTLAVRMGMIDIERIVINLR